MSEDGGASGRLDPDELIDGIEFGGAATYLGDAIQSKVTLFI
jgi:hypothetical protein